MPVPFLKVKNIIMEIWKSVTGYENIYEVSNYGRLKSLERDVTLFIMKEKILKCCIVDGYVKCILSKNKEYKSHKLHRLVAREFCPGYDKNLTVNHIDGNKSNNHYTNLEWVTNRENVLHAFRIGLMANSAHNTKCKKILHKPTGKIHSSITDVSKIYNIPYGSLYYGLRKNKLTDFELK